jgi:hypothetical protein
LCLTDVFLLLFALFEPARSLNLFVDSLKCVSGDAKYS